jgi:hypothetical protein
VFCDFFAPDLDIAAFVQRRVDGRRPLDRARLALPTLSSMERLELLIVDRPPIVDAAVLGRGFKGI